MPVARKESDRVLGWIRLLAVALASTAVILLVVSIWMGASEAQRHPSIGLAPAEDEEAIRGARDFWDNPFERLLYFSMAVTSATPVGDGSCKEYEVTAYTFFGSVASVMEMDCSGGARRISAAPSTPIAYPSEFASLLVGTHFDYDPSDSPRELASWMDGVVVGTFESVADGPVEVIAEGVYVNHVVFAVRVEQVVAGAPDDLLTDQHIYLEFTRASNTPVEAYRAAMPTGKVLLFIAKSTFPPGVVENEGAGRPEGASLYFVHPEGFWIETADGDVPILLSSERPIQRHWGGIDSIAEIAAALEDGR
jgi:hypothetical protein